MPSFPHLITKGESYKSADKLLHHHEDNENGYLCFKIKNITLDSGVPMPRGGRMMAYFILGKIVS